MKRTLLALFTGHRGRARLLALLTGGAGRARLLALLPGRARLLALLTGRPGRSRRRRTAHTAISATVVLAVLGALAPDDPDTLGANRLAGAPSASAAPSRPAEATGSPAPAVAVPASAPASATAAASPSRPAASRSPAAAPTGRPAPPRPVATRPVATRPPASQPAPKPSPKRTQAATCGAPANPWGYHHCGSGRTISDPPAAFCSYFNCIGAFWDGAGYVIRCDDGEYSKSGGRRGACSHHGGVDVPLYA